MNQSLSVTVRGPKMKPLYLFDVGDFLVSPLTGAVGVKTDEFSVLWITGPNPGHTSNALVGSPVVTAGILMLLYIVPADITIEVEL